jgi:hypothetical protein
MRNIFTRISVVAVLASTAVVATAAPAMAAPSGIGWSGSWEYTSTSTLTIGEAVPGARLSASGTDTGNSRSFSVTLTDTSPGDGKCAEVTWYDGSLLTSTSACGTSITFNPIGEDGDISATLCLQSPSNGAKTHCNDGVDVPSTYSEAYLRQPGWGVTWDYYTDPVEEDPFEWGATVLMGPVWASVFGMDNYTSPTGRLLAPSVTMQNTGMFICGSVTTLDTSPASSKQVCGPNQIADAPNTKSIQPYGSGFQGCLWSTLTLIGHPITKDCVVAGVPIPN